MRNILYICVVLILSACSAAPSIATPQATAPQVTPTITLTPTQTATPEPTPTNTPIPDEVLQDILGVYRVLLFTEINANLLQTTAEKVNAGEVSGFESFGMLIGLATLVQAVEEAIDETEVPMMFSTYWEQTMPIHVGLKDLIAGWFNKEIDSSVVLTEIAPFAQEIDQILSTFEDELALTYGFDRGEMQTYREETIQEINRIFDDED